MLGRHIDEIWPPKIAAALKRNLARALTGERFAVEYHDRDLGSVTSYVPHKTEDGVVGVVVFSADARDIQATRSALMHAEKMATLNRLVATILHELNTPLAALKAGGPLLKRTLEKLALPVDQQQRIDRLLAPGVAALERMVTVLDGLRRLVRLDQAEEQRVDLHECIDSAVALGVTQFDPSVRVEKRFGDLPPLSCRAAELTQLFLITLRVVGAHVTKGSVIVITTRAAAEWIEVTIAFDGTIDAEAISGMVQHEPGATDLGLRVARDIAHRHGGDVRVGPSGDALSRVVVVLPP
jgi:two-component system NtrC family sensor kinase